MHMMRVVTWESLAGLFQFGCFLCLLGHMVMSHHVSSNGVNVWIVDKKGAGLHCTWVIESALGHHLCLKMLFQLDVDGFLDTPPKPVIFSDQYRYLTVVKGVSTFCSVSYTGAQILGKLYILRFKIIIAHQHWCVNVNKLKTRIFKEVKVRYWFSWSAEVAKHAMALFSHPEGHYGLSI